MEVTHMCIIYSRCCFSISPIACELNSLMRSKHWSNFASGCQSSR
jgi:hypothetical protein